LFPPERTAQRGISLQRFKDLVSVPFTQIDPTGRLQAPEETVVSAGLRYVSSEASGIERRRHGKGFTYLGPNGRTLRDRGEIDRIRKLAIPPAWTDVWICPDPDGHLQATGFDARGRKQYRYNAEFRALRESAKFEHIVVFAQTLPAIRERVRRDMARHGLPREKVLATVVHLLETTLARVGNKDYARENGSFGLTTLREPHVEVNGNQLKFRFKGKSGKVWNLKVKDRRVAKIVRACQELPGQQLFQYLDDKGEVQDITSSDVNAYLREISGREITAKDFRTWTATVMAATALDAAGPPETATAAKRTTRAAIAEVAERLGNTATICRKCYVHPAVIEAYAAGELKLTIREKAQANPSELSAGEAAVYRFLVARLS
jgi:DNA topoisomerase-1